MGKYRDIITIAFVACFLIIFYLLNKVDEAKELQTQKTIIQIELDIQEIDQALTNLETGLVRITNNLKKELEIE
tara:strand:- start:90 stop:311 length:222 start_codon:yes stop_codon:yes gene_type:complete